MDSNTVLRALQAVLPADALVLDVDAIAPYRVDRALDPAAGTPLAVVLARSVADVQAAVRVAAAHGIPVVPRGRGTGLSGGASALEGGIVVSTQEMCEIRVDLGTRTLVAEAGALNADVKAAAAAHGLWYPPDPASFEICSIGGNVATNAGGLCCVKYGVTRDYVLGLNVVLADGSLVELGGPLVKDVAGLPLVQLFVGSEGTLGIITSATLRLVPKQTPPVTVVASFDSVEAAMDVVQAVSAETRPAMLEFMDGSTIRAVAPIHSVGLDTDAEAMLVIQSDLPGEAGVAEAARFADACAATARTVRVFDDPALGEPWVAARRDAIPSVQGDRGLLLGDVGVPLPELGRLLVGVRDIALRSDVTIAMIAHAGDGNTHPLVVLDLEDAEQVARAHQAYAEVTELAISLGGTLTGEHGVGRLKLPWLERSVGADVVALSRRVKAALDPAGILNPGAGF
ncbi:MAG TPA: FAD-linked oxidase C-terminal domain-containing protein [Pseudolysinimonas sp.]|nr:FAD-linked oxidase C-terminal domain-containing protein [Pseudolysinimonas sp.]